MIIEFANDDALLMPVYPRSSDKHPGIMFYDGERTYSW